MQVLGG
jgi:hypothetical protein